MKTVGLIFALGLSSILASEDSARILETVSHTFAQLGAKCLTLIEDRGLGIARGHSLDLLPLHELEMEASVELRFSSNLCPFYFFHVLDHQRLVEFAKTREQELKRRDAFYLIFMNNNSNNNISEIFENFVPEAINLVLIMRAENGFGVYQRQSCDDGIQIKNLIHLNGSTLIKDRLLFQGKQDFSCKTIRATTFEYKPFVIIDQETQQYRGIEMEVFYMIAQKLGFKFTLDPPSDGDLWGNEITPGNYSGLNGDLQHRRSDMGWANTFVLPGFRHYIDYATYDMERICFLMKKPERYPVWMSAVSAFDFLIWMGLIAVMTAVGVATVVYSQVHWQPELRASDVLYVLAAGLVDASQPNLKYAKSISLRLFFGIFFISSFILTTAYRSAFTSTLSIPSVKKPIETLEQLAEHPTPVSSFLGNMQRFVRQSTDPVLVKLAERYGSHYDLDGAFQNASQGRLIMGESRNFLDYKIRSQFTNKYGETDMQLMKECLFTFRVALILQKDSPLKTVVSEAIQSMTEAGFIQKWTRDAMDQVARLVSGHNLGVNKPWTVADLQVAFILYLIVFCCSFVAFIVEISSKLKF